MNCNFCSLHRQFTRSHEVVATYMAALAQELTIFYESVASPETTALYIGGGTPSILSPEELGTLLDCIARPTESEVEPEVTLECAPDFARDATMWTAYLGDLAARTSLRVNRLSIGLQAWDERTLQRMGRQATQRSIIDFLSAAQEVIPNYNVDFILGYPRHDLPSVAHEAAEIVCAVEELLALGFSLPSISIYQLWDVSQIPATRTRLERQPSSAEILNALWLLQSSLFTLGYMPGTDTTFVRNASNRHQWKIHRYKEFRHLGFGSGSYSFLPRGFIQRERDIHGYQKLLQSNDVPSLSTIDRGLNRHCQLTSEEIEIRRIILGLRTGDPIWFSADKLANFESLSADDFIGKVSYLCDCGVLIADREGWISVSSNAFILANSISAFLHPGGVPRKNPT